MAAATAVAANSSVRNPSLAAEFNPYRWWHARFWHGMTTPVWFDLASRNRYAFEPYRWGMAATVSGVSVINSAFSGAQHLVFGRTIAETKIEHPPVFIIGHWRSGTTYLHQLMVMDKRFAYPNTYDCMAPSHTLLTGSVLPWFLGFLLPSKRPMDNVSVGWGEPQEDEFALCNLGAKSPYSRIAFPNQPQGDDFLDLDDASESDRQAWREVMLWFMQMLTYRDKRTLVLKSPPHTARVAHLASLFPGAKFIHIVRNPYELYSSTRRLWQSLYESQGFQHPQLQDLDEYVFRCFEKMYTAFHKQRSEIPAGNYAEVRFPDLVRNPLLQLERIYHELKLGDFEPAREVISSFAKEQADYKGNTHQVDAALKAEIDRRWGPLVEEWGTLE